MENISGIKKLISSDKKELSQFVLDLCGFTLNDAGFDSQSYAYYLNMAFRHQTIVQSNEWEAICELVTSISHLTLNPGVAQPLSGQVPQITIQEPSSALGAPSTQVLGEGKNKGRYLEDEVWQRIAKFAQSIVTEVSQASQDNWAIKLIKTNYLSKLDRARNSSEQAIKLINAQKEQPLTDIHASGTSSKAPLPNDITEVLRANKAYLHSLLGLPFIMEKIILSIAKNQPGANYQPQKTAEMLAKTLDTINAGLSIDAADQRREVLVAGLKLALEIAMPDVQLADHQLVDAINDHLLPFLNKLIEKIKTLETRKASIFPKNPDGSDTESTKARKELLAALNVRFDSIQDILKETLIEPVKQCNQAVTGALGLGVAVNNIVKTDDKFTQAIEMAAVFENFDKIASIGGQINPDLLPSWLRQANDYYQQIKVGAQKINRVAQGALGILDVLYIIDVPLISSGARRSLEHANALTKVLTETEKEQIEFKPDLVMAYLIFYELIKQGDIKDPELKANLFAAYMPEVVKADNRIQSDELTFDVYKVFEQQLNIQHSNQTLASSIEAYDRKLSDSMTIPHSEDTEVVNQSNLLKFDILLMVNRLHTLENKFNVTNSNASFEELAEAFAASEQSPSKVFLSFKTAFLQPAMQRMLSQYQTHRLVPLIESMLKSNNTDTPKLRAVYSKLKEEINLTSEDLGFLQNYWADHSNWTSQKTMEFQKELTSTEQVAAKLADDRQPTKVNWDTPEEKSIKDATAILGHTKLPINLLLTALQDHLAKQKGTSTALEVLTDNPKVKSLCEQKNTYISTLDTLIEKLKNDINNNEGELQKHLMKIITGEIVPLTKKQLTEHTSSLSSIPNKLISLAWNVLPVTADTDDKPQLNDSFIYNLLDYYLNLSDTPIGAVIEAESSFKKEVNKNPLPALIKQLGDPLLLANVSKEKIVDTGVKIVAEQAAEIVVDQGALLVRDQLRDYARAQNNSTSGLGILADAAARILTDKPLRDKIFSYIGSIFKARGGQVAEKAVELKDNAIDAVKGQIYPILGIEIQKSIEARAYNYLLNPNNTNSKERDSFATYYLQYREIKQNKQDANIGDVIQFLFSEFLAKKKEEEQLQIKGKIAEEFIRLDSVLPDQAPPELNAIERSDHQLQFIIQNIDLSDPTNDTIIKLALVNRFLIMTMETAEQLTDENQISKIQEQAIHNLSQTLEQFKKLPRQDETNEQNEAMVEVISGANKKATTMQLKKVISNLKNAKNHVNEEVKQHKAMLDSNEPLLGLSLLEWEYHKSSNARKVAITLSSLVKLVGPIFSWVGIIGSILATNGMLQALAISVGLSASATGIGLAVFAAGALLCLAWNFASKLIENLGEFKKISQEDTSWWKKAGNFTLLGLKCLGLALAKTCLIDYLIAKVSTLLAFGPIARLRNAFRFWPTRETVEQEQTQLESLQGKLDILIQLIDTKIKFLDKKTKPDSKEFFPDNSLAIAKAINELNIEMVAVETSLDNVSINDARFSEKKYSTVIKDLKDQFAKLTQELNTLQKVQNAQASLPATKHADAASNQILSTMTGIDEPQDASESKAVVVNLEAYRMKIHSEQQSKQNSAGQSMPKGLLTKFSSLFRPAPAVDAPDTVNQTEALPPQDEPNPKV